MKASKTKRNIGNMMLIAGMVLSAVSIPQASYALSSHEVCERPVFKLWKTQQAKRLWAPNEETLLAEKSGKVFTYNCFSFSEIKQFFNSQENRIENAHFHPILLNEASLLQDESKTDQITIVIAVSLRRLLQ